MTELMEENILREESYHFGKIDEIKEGIERGIEQGIEKNKRDIVINMFKKNFDLNMISDITKLSVNKIYNIINNN